MSSSCKVIWELINQGNEKKVTISPSLSSFPWCVHPAGHYIKEKERQASIEDEQHKEMKEKMNDR